MLILFLFGLHFLQRGLMFHHIHTFIMFKHAEFGKHTWIHTSILKKHAHFKISSRDEVFTCLFFFFSSWDEISSLFHLGQKCVNSKRHFTIDRDYFIPRWNFTCKHPLIDQKMCMKEIMFTKTVQDECNWMFVLHEKCSEKFYSHFVIILILPLDTS